VRVHRSREHAPEFEALDLRLESRRIARDGVDGLALAFALGQFQQLERAGDAVADRVEASGQVGELRAFAPQRLRTLGVVPDLGVFQLAADFG
jgi:hypothetical protein